MRFSSSRTAIVGSPVPPGSDWLESRCEIALKHRQGKLTLPLVPLRWLRALEDRFGLTIDPKFSPYGVEVVH